MLSSPKYILSIFLFLVTQTNHIDYKNKYYRQGYLDSLETVPFYLHGLPHGGKCSWVLVLDISFHILDVSIKEFLLPSGSSFSDPLSKGTTFL